MLSRAKRPIIGWREFVSLPDWGVVHIEAKIDTGARTSAIHVEDVRALRGDRVQFHLIVSRRKPFRHVLVKAPLVRMTRVRSSTGQVQQRFVVAARVRIGRVVKRIEMSLVGRDKMLCRMLLGRSAVSGFVVDVDQRYVLGRPVRLRPPHGVLATSKGESEPRP
jgi:hypothetical protein